MVITNEAVERLVSTLNLNHWLIEKHLEGLSHEQTMIQAPYNINRMNWVLGHIAEHRDWMLRYLGEETLMSDDEVQMYRRGSESLQDDSEAIQVETLLGYLRQAKDNIIAILENAEEEFLAEVPQTAICLENHRTQTRLQRVQGLVWHETYHIGQVDLLRQVAGMNDAILQ